MCGTRSYAATSASGVVLCNFNSVFEGWCLGRKLRFHIFSVQDVSFTSLDFYLLRGVSHESFVFTSPTLSLFERHLARNRRFHIFSFQFLKDVSNESVVFTSSAFRFLGDVWHESFVFAQVLQLTCDEVAAMNFCWFFSFSAPFTFIFLCENPSKKLRFFKNLRSRSKSRFFRFWSRALARRSFCLANAILMASATYGFLQLAACKSYCVNSALRCCCARGSIVCCNSLLANHIAVAASLLLYVAIARVVPWFFATWCLQIASECAKVAPMSFLIFSSILALAIFLVNSLKEASNWYLRYLSVALAPRSSFGASLGPEKNWDDLRC